MTPDDGGPGSVADEAARLVAALRGRAAAGTPSPGRPPAPQPDEGHDERPAHGHPENDGQPEAQQPEAQHGPTASADCGWCPVCLLARGVRGVRPETVEALADVLALGAQGLRDLAATARGRSAPVADEPPAGPARDAGRPPQDGDDTPHPHAGEHQP